MAKLKRRTKDGIWDERLMCHVQRLTYDAQNRTGRLHFPQAECCDMRGAIKIFTGIDPEVQLIETFSGNEPDTIYQFNTAKRKWEAFMPCSQA
jgi:hypothetical protein